MPVMEKEKEVAVATPPKPTVETSLGDLVAAEPALEHLLQRPLAAQPAYHLAKLARLVKAETAHFHSKRDDLIKELGSERDSTPMELAAGGPAKILAVKPENIETFIKRVKELADVSVTINWGPIRLTDLGEAPIVPADLLTLGALLSDV